MTSVCDGCACEDACGHAGLRACAYRRPARWCSCAMLRRAQVERDALLRLKCKREAEIVRLEEELARMHDICLLYTSATERHGNLLAFLACRQNPHESSRPDLSPTPITAL